MVRELASRIEYRRAAHQTDAPAFDLSFAEQIMTELHHNRGMGDSVFSYDSYSGANPEREAGPPGLRLVDQGRPERPHGHARIQADRRPP